MQQFSLVMGALAAAREIFSWVSKQIEIAKQTGELTPDQEASLRRAQEDTMRTAPWWRKSTDQT